MTDSDASNRQRYRVVELPKGGRSEVWLELRGERVEQNFSNKYPQGSNGGGGGWTRCPQHACVGEALTQGGSCYAHASSQERQDFLHQIAKSGGRPLSLRGTSISQQLWDEIAASAVMLGGRPIVPINLSGAEIDAEIRFTGHDFEHYLELSGATFFKNMEYRGCTFKAGVVARQVRFDAGGLTCYQCVFKEDVDFSYCQVHGVALAFEGCKFERALKADGFSGGGLNLTKSEVHGAVSLNHCAAHLILGEAQLSGEVNLHDAECRGFFGERLTVRTAHRLGPFATSSLNLARASFGARILIEVRAAHVDLSSASFDQGGLLVLAETARVQLEQVRLGGPMRITGSASAKGKPQVPTLRNADAGKMTFANVDLSRCSFQGAHGLGTLEIESSVSLASAPWWLGGRRFIADEYAWRSSAGLIHRLGWKLDGVHVGLELPPRVRGIAPPLLLQPLDAMQVASIYRDLRRSLEAKSDMPGAADFYYGEMEMRRWSRSRVWLERALVWCYWLTCGYGLRAGRALLFWVVLVWIGTESLYRVGFASQPSYQQGFLSAVRASIPGFAATPCLTLQGQWIEVVLRVLGALALALFLIAARAMVMRKPSES